MNKYIVWVDVNDGEYLTKMVVFANSCVACDVVEMDDEMVYPVIIDGRIVYFDEKVEIEKDK